MRVLMLNERDLSHPLAGGVEVHLEELARRLQANHGIGMTVLCAGFDGAVADEERNGIRYVRFGDRFSYYAQLPARARKEWATGDYDLVVENLCKLLFFSQFYLPAAPKLALVHHLFGLSAFRQVAVPIAAFVAATEALLPIAYRRWPFVVVSPSTRDDLRRRLLPTDRVRVIPNGLDHDKFHPDPGVATDPELVVFVGRLEYYKGVDILLEAWAQLVRRRPSARLVLVGAGTAEQALRSQASSCGATESITFAGFVSEEEKIDWMRRASVVVQPSHKEGWGLTVVEANACGTPVVATRVPGLQDSVRDGENGLLVERADVPGLAAALESLLDDSGLRAALSEGALRWATRFRWDAVAAAFAEVVRAVAAREEIPATPDFLGGLVAEGSA